MQRAQVGNVELIGMVDTHFSFPATDIYPEAGDALGRYARRLSPEGALTPICACFLLRADGQTILVDTGMGPDGEAQLQMELSAAGVAPPDVDTVVLTHLHPDHIGGNIDRESKQASFPKARYWAPQADWDAFGSHDAFKRDVAPLQSLERLQLFSGEKTLTASLTLLPTPGHTPGHTSIAIVSAGEQGFILGDVVISQISIDEPSWKVVFDSDSAQAEATRRRILDRLEAGGEVVGASQLPPQGMGRFVKASGGRVWQPLE